MFDAWDDQFWSGIDMGQCLYESGDFATRYFDICSTPLLRMHIVCSGLLYRALCIFFYILPKLKWVIARLSGYYFAKLYFTYVYIQKIDFARVCLIFYAVGRKEVKTDYYLDDMLMASKIQRCQSLRMKSTYSVASVTFYYSRGIWMYLTIFVYE